MALQQTGDLVDSGEYNVASYQFQNEDHTLGNALRYMLAKDPEVAFVGYSVPHPSEPMMNLRIQTHKPAMPSHVLKKALENLQFVWQTLDRKYASAVERHSRKMGDRD